MRAQVPAVLLLVAAGGCAGLEGSWSGKVSCDGGSVPISLDIQHEDGPAYSADGSVRRLVWDGVEAIVDLKLDIERTEAFGPQKLDVEARCSMFFADGRDPVDMDCSRFDELAWDGEDLIDARLLDFLGLGDDCDIELERD